MSTQPLIWMVGIQCKPESEAKFNAWYDEVHVPMLLAGGHARKVTRFKLADDDRQMGTAIQSCPNYLTVYEFDDQAQFDAWMTGRARAEAGVDKENTWSADPYEVRWATRYDLINTWNAA